MSLFSNPTTYSVIAAFLSAIAAIASATAAWRNLRTAEENLFNQQIQTHRVNLKNLADACNCHLSSINKAINKPSAIKHFYYTFLEALYAMKTVEHEKKMYDSLVKYFYLNLNHSVHDEIKKGAFLEELFQLEPPSEEEKKLFSTVKDKTSKYYDSEN